MSEKVYNVLFLCTGNSARSILAEGILRHKGAGRFHAYSAGSHPSGTVREGALRELAAHGISTEGFRSKSWDEFAGPDAPVLDFIFTVCDNAANEACPYWPGHPVSAHWGVPDPAAVEGSDVEIARAYHEAYLALERRIGLFMALSPVSLAAMNVKNVLSEIGKQ